MFKLTKKKIGIVIFLALLLFYSLGTGFPFFYRFLFATILLLLIGFAWAWLNLRGLEINLDRRATRGQVGDYLDGHIQVINRNRIHKSWLEVKEITDLPGYASGRGIALVKDQRRNWRTQTYLSKRGIYTSRQIEVTSQDPFGLFRMRRRFLNNQPYIVFPYTERLPNLDPQLAQLPSDSRYIRPANHITPESSSIREYVQGDSFRSIHWPYTARMNQLMVKQFDIGISADTWIILDMFERSHNLRDPIDNTEELTVKIAASLIQRTTELGISTGLAAKADQNYLLKPDTSPAYLPLLMESLAGMRAIGKSPLEELIYDIKPQLNQFNTVNIIATSIRQEWVSALTNLKREGINTSVIYIDPVSFGSIDSSQSGLELLHLSDIRTYLVRKDDSLNEALSKPLDDQIWTDSESATTSPLGNPGL